MRYALWALLAATFCAASTSCGHHAINKPDDQQGRAFIDAVKQLPMAQRAAYVQAHPDGVNAVVQSRDRQLYNSYNELLRSPH